jgi:hypothetical protein
MPSVEGAPQIRQRIVTSLHYNVLQLPLLRRIPLAMPDAHAKLRICDDAIKKVTLPTICPIATARAVLLRARALL